MPRRVRVDDAATLEKLLQDKNAKLWMDRYMQCCYHSEKVKVDMLRDSLINGREAFYKEYEIAQVDHIASKDPRYPYVLGDATDEERAVFWEKLDKLFPCYPETLYEKCMHLCVGTIGAQVISSSELDQYDMKTRALLMLEADREALRVLDSQGWLVTKNPHTLSSYPSSPFEYLRKWVGKSFQLWNQADTMKYTVESVSTSETGKPIYTIRRPSGEVDELSEQELNAMVWNLRTPQ